MNFFSLHGWAVGKCFIGIDLMYSCHMDKAEFKKIQDFGVISDSSAPSLGFLDYWLDTEEKGGQLTEGKKPCLLTRVLDSWLCSTEADLKPQSEGLSAALQAWKGPDADISDAPELNGWLVDLLTLTRNPWHASLFQTHRAACSSPVGLVWRGLLFSCPQLLCGFHSFPVLSHVGGKAWERQPHPIRIFLLSQWNWHTGANEWVTFRSPSQLNPITAMHLSREGKSGARGTNVR